MDNLAVVVIPIYKRDLSYLEKISLRQVDNILKSYKKTFVAPMSLDFDYGIHYEVVRFPDVNFTSTATYSELLMTEEFYDRFSDYRFMLIYQLDAFVFSDKLKKYCEEGYDYIGAPISGGDWQYYHVGNGGFSLRNIKSAKRMLKEKKWIVDEIRSTINPSRLDEDVFWGYCGSSSKIDFKVPSPRYASTFAVQSDYVHGLRDIKKRGLPFGCHSWWQYDYDIWKLYIESYGFYLPNMNSKSSVLNDKMKRLLFLTKRFIREKYGMKNSLGFDKILPKNRSIYMYGGGGWGYMSIKFFSYFSMENIIKGVYDTKIQKENFYGYPIIYPTQETISDGFIVITTLYYLDEVEKHLLELGLQKHVDFCSIFDMCKIIVGDSIDINAL